MASWYRTVGMAVLSVARVGCASAPKVYESVFPEHPRYSRAMTVLLAAGYVDDPAKSPIRDAPQAKAAQAPKSGGLGGLETQLKQALEEALRERLPAPFTVSPPNPKHPARLVIEGGPCHEKGHPCVFRAAVHSQPVAGMAPGILGGGSAWVWHPIGRPSEVLAAPLLESTRVSGDWTKPHRDGLPDLAIYQDWSKRLPEWVFLHLAPTTPISLGNGQGFLQFPVILNQGTALYFVSPGA